MREIGFANTFSTVATLGLAFHAGARRSQNDQDMLDAAQERLAFARLENAMLENIMLRSMMAERDAAQQ